MDLVVACCLVSQLCLALWRPHGVHQAPLSMGFPRQEYWSGLPFPAPGDLPDLGIKSAFLVSSALADGFFTTESRPGSSSHFIDRGSNTLPC